jgi:hypothetical protein
MLIINNKKYIVEQYRRELQLNDFLYGPSKYWCLIQINIDDPTKYKLKKGKF